MVRLCLDTVTWSDTDRNLHLSFFLSFLQILDGSGHVKFCVDASKPDTGSWLKHIQFAPTTTQHNLTACQVDDQVCGDTIAQHKESKEKENVDDLLLISSQTSQSSCFLTLMLFPIFVLLVKNCYCDPSQINAAGLPSVYTHTSVCCTDTPRYQAMFSHCNGAVASAVQRPQGMIRRGRAGMIVLLTSLSRLRYKLSDMHGMSQSFCCSPGCRKVRAAQMGACSSP